MAVKFKDTININGQYTLPLTDGTDGQVLVTDGAGNLTFTSEPVAGSADSAESTHLNVKNTSGASIAKGTPVYVTGSVGNTDKLEIAPANASNASHMPAIGLLESTLANNGEGFVVQGGLLKGLVTDTIDGSASTANDTVYVKAGGGLTLTKPTGSTNFIQNIAKVARVHSSNGSLIVSSILRTNDVPNLSTGKIWVGDGNTFESTVVHIDETNGRLGIGIDIPTESLHVLSSGNISRFESTTATSNVVIENSTITTKIGSVSNNFVVDLDPTDSVASSNIILKSDGTERARFKSSGDVSFRDTSINEAFYWDASAASLGIGTTNPSNTTHIYKNATIGAITSTTTANAALRIQDSSSNMYFDGNSIVLDNTGYLTTNGAYDFVLGTNNTPRIHIDSGGNVGIGTDSPSAPLHIFKASHPNTLLARFENPSGEALVEIKAQNDALSVLQFADSEDGNVGAIQYSHADNSMRFKTADAERMRIVSGGGIQIPNVNATNEIQLTGAEYSNIYSETTAGFDIGTNSSSGTSYLRLLTENAERLRIDSSGVTSVYNDFVLDYASPEMYFKTGPTHYRWMIAAQENVHAAFEITPSTTVGGTTYSTPVAVFKATGNVGIGTTNPSNTTHIYKNATIGAITSTTTANAGLRIQDSGSSMYFDGNSIVLDNTGYLTTNGAYDFVLGTNNTPRIHIDSGGNVGIGITNPSNNLSIVDSGNATLEINGQGRVNSLTLGVTASESKLFENSNNALAFGTNATERMRIEADGDVGIGTSSPSAKLQVRGSSEILRIEDSSSTGNPYMSFYQNGTRRGLIQLINGGLLSLVSEYGDIRFMTATNGSEVERMRITSGGNIGINTTNPTSISYTYAQDLVINGGASSADGVGISLVSNGKTYGVIAFGDAADTNAGEIYYSHSANDMVFRVNAGTQLQIEPGYVFANNQMRSPIFYDSSDTNWFVNPASTSITVPSGKFAQYVQIGDSTTYNSNNGTWGARLNVTDNIHARIDVGQDANSMLSSWYAHTGNTGPIFGSMTAHPMRMMYNTAEVGFWDSTKIQHSSSVRAPEFYDSDNTAYYMSYWGGGALRGNFEFAANTTSTSYQYASIELRESNFTGNANATPPFIGFHWGGVVASSIAIESNGRIAIRNNPGTSYEDFIAASITAPVDMRAPIFYDTDNTGYYVDPSSTSKFETINIVDSASTHGVLHTDDPYHGLTMRGYPNTANSIAMTAGDYMSFWEYGGVFRFYKKRPSVLTLQAWIDNGSITATTDSRAPIFYDSDNTGYYVNPAGNSSIKGVDRGLTQVSGWVPAYSAVDPSFTLWSQDEDAVELASSGDSSIGMSFRARRIASGQTVRFTVTLKGSEVKSNGLYIRLSVYNGSLPDGKTHVSNNASNSSPFVVEDSSQVTNWYENGAIGTSWQTESYEYTATSDCYVSLTILNWTGLSTSSVFVKNPDIQTVQIRQGTYFDDDNTNFYANFNAVGDSIRAAGDIVAYYSSDKNLKDNIIKIDGALDKVNAIGGYTFEWNEESHKQTGSEDVGVIAQEVEEIFPEIVQTRSNGYKAVQYEKLVPLLIEAVKELSEKVKILENK